MKNFFTIIFISSIVLLLQSCYKDVGPIDEGEAPLTNVSFTQHVQPIFDSQCISCHGNSGNLNLSSNVSYNNLVNVNASGYSGKRVVPNDSNNSILFIKVDGSNAFGSNMPLGGTLSATQINTIKQWIDEGAQNN
jgi:mono/diheme cytochrome c family protein